MTSPPPPDRVSSASAFKATIAVTAIILVSQALGVFRESAMAAVFGAGQITDAYFVALMIPNILAVVLAGGVQTVGTSLLGEYVYQPQKRTDLGDVVWSLFHMVLVFVSGLALLQVLLVPLCLDWIAPGFNAEQLALARRLSVVLAFIVVFIGLGGWCQSVLQIFQRFTPTALSHIYFNAVLIAAIFVSRTGGGIITVSAGMLIAQAVMFGSQIPATIRSLPPYRPVLKWSHPAVRNMAAQMIPVGLRMAVQMVNAIVERFLASRLVAGSISALEYANRTFQLPISAFGNTVVTVLYSAMTALRASGDGERFQRAFVRGLRMLAFIFIPITVGLIVFRMEIIRLLFERGAFDRQASDLTATALTFYSLGLLFTVWRSHTIQALAALEDFMTPLWATLVSLLANMLFNVWLVRYLQHGGIALGKTLGEAVWFLILYRQMRIRLGPLGGLEILRASIRISLAAGVAGLAADAIRKTSAWSGIEPVLIQTAGRLPGSAAAQAVTLISLGCLYLGIFLACCAVLRTPELRETLDLTRNAMGSGRAESPRI